MSGSGAQIRTEDLRVMSSNLAPAHFFVKYVLFGSKYWLK
jgi:hypothetical protein